MVNRTRLLARRERPALWAAALFVVLAGLFGMHGLGDHGMPGMAHISVTGTTAHPDMTGHADRSGVAVPVPEAPAALDRAGLDGHAGMAGMCLALLAGGWLALLLLRSRAVRVLAVTPHRALVARRPRTRDPDPPSLTSLSILRC